jgi:hypothetical protein
MSTPVGRIRRWSTHFLALCALAPALAAPRLSEATMVLPAATPVGSTLVFSQSGFLSDVPLPVDFDVPTAGLLTVDLTDLGLPRPFECLTFLLTSGSSVLGEVVAGTPFTLQLAAPQRLFGFLQGDPQGPLNRGAYLLQVSVHPAVVPLPAAAWLLLSALGGFSFLLKHSRSRSA